MLNPLYDDRIFLKKAKCNSISFIYFFLSKKNVINCTSYMHNSKFGNKNSIQCNKNWQNLWIFF